MKTKKQLLALLLTMIMVLCSFPVSAVASAAGNSSEIVTPGEIEDGGVYRIRNAYSGKYVDYGTTNVFQRELDESSDTQKFIIEEAEGIAYGGQFIKTLDGQYVRVQNLIWGETNVIVGPYAEETSMGSRYSLCTWNFVQTSADGRTTIQNIGHSYATKGYAGYLKINDWMTGSEAGTGLNAGGNIISSERQEGSSGLANEWYIEKVVEEPVGPISPSELEDGGVYRIKNTYTNKYVDHGTANVFQTEFDAASDTQKFIFEKVDSNSQWSDWYIKTLDGQYVRTYDLMWGETNIIVGPYAEQTVMGSLQSMCKWEIGQIWNTDKVEIINTGHRMTTKNNAGVFTVNDWMTGSETGTGLQTGGNIISSEGQDGVKGHYAEWHIEKAD